MSINIAYLLLGSNLNNRLRMIEQAIDKISEAGVRIIQSSHIYETAAWGNTEQEPFLNAALKVETTKTAEELLPILINIEKEMGRERQQKWGPRLIDIDILFFNSDIIDTGNLVIPHPYLHLRRFTLQPLAEIAGGYVHPVIKKTVNELLEICPDKLEVKIVS